MKKILHSLLITTFAGGIILLSCRKVCDDCKEFNKSPVAHAGRNTTIMLPVDSVLLDGSGSSDPDGTISAWQWTKIAGPASFVISNASAEKTIVKNLTSGVYHFELKVTDDKGASAKDIVQVRVNAGAAFAACDNSNRPHINVRLVPVGHLSKPRLAMVVASERNKLLFAGGNCPDCPEC